MVLHVPADNLREGLIQNGRQTHSSWRHDYCPGILLEAKIFRKSHLPTSQGCQRVNLWRARYKRRSGITDAEHQQKWLHQRKCRGEIPREIITNEYVKSGQNYKVNRCLARYSPRATTNNRPTNRALNKPAWPGPN